MNTDVTMSVSIVDNGVAIHTDNLTEVYAGVYSERQRAMVGRCEYTPDGDRLILKSPAVNQRFEGPCRLILSCTMDERKATYDAMAFEVVRWSADVLPPQDLEEASEPIGIHIEFSEISSSFVHEVLAAAIAATDAALNAAANTDEAVQAASAAAIEASTQAKAAEQGAVRANAAAGLAEQNAGKAEDAAERAVEAAENVENAITAATTAAARANDAAASAEGAAGRAEAGASAANNAAASVNEAKDAATAAAGRAETAATSAEAAAKRANDAAEVIEGVNTELESQAQQIEDLQNMKIDKENDDYYPMMAVGLADNLAGVDVVDSEFNFRRSGGGAITDGVARIESIKGNSVVWNQGFKKGSSSAGTWDENILTINGTYASDATSYDIATYNSEFVAPVANHKYYISIEIISGTIVGDLAYVVYPAASYTRVVLNNSNKVYQGIISQIDANNDYWFIRTKTAGSEYANLKVCHVVRDLTKMFGAGNEPTTIEEFYQRIPMGVDLNAYNEGEVIHMDVQSIESVGVNQWDEEWELGGLLADGSPSSDANRIRSKNYITVLPREYNCNKSLTIFFYDWDYNIISYRVVANTFTPPSNCRYIKFYYYGVTTYSHDICINISDPSINGQYFPYIKRVEDLSIIRKYFPDGMRSAGSAHDEIRYNKASGKWEKVVRIREVDLGNMGYTASASYQGLFYAAIAGVKIVATDYEVGNILCANYTTRKRVDMHEDDKVCALDKYGNVFIKDSAYADVATFKSAMKGVMLYCELAEPIITELDEADQFKDLDYAVWNAGTEKAIAEGKSAPLAADITYGFNAIGKIKELESLVAALRAKVGI